MSATPQAPAAQPLHRGIVKQVSEKLKCGIFVVICELALWFSKWHRS